MNVSYSMVRRVYSDTSSTAPRLACACQCEQGSGCVRLGCYCKLYSSVHIGSVVDAWRCAGSHWKQLESCWKMGKNVVYYCMCHFCSSLCQENWCPWPQAKHCRGFHLLVLGWPTLMDHTQSGYFLIECECSRHPHRALPVPPSLT